MVDVIVIGGGIAGVSVAAELSESMSVVLLESEPSLAYHTTGRSAALYFGSYGHPDVVQLTRDSRAWFENPPNAAPSPFHLEQTSQTIRALRRFLLTQLESWCQRSAQI